MKRRKCLLIPAIFAFALLLLAFFRLAIRDFNSSLIVTPALPNSALISWRLLPVPLLRYVIEKQTITGWEQIGKSGTESFTRLRPGSSEHYRVKVTGLSYLTTKEVDFNAPADADQDGLFDLFETAENTQTSPLLFSTSGCSAPDGFFVSYHLSPLSAAHEDPDGDGRDNEAEFLDKTNPLVKDNAGNTGQPAPSAAEKLELVTNDDGNTLTWVNPSTEIRIIIERTDDGANWITVGHATGQSFTDYVAKKDHVYFYRVIAHN